MAIGTTLQSLLQSVKDKELPDLYNRKSHVLVIPKDKKIIKEAVMNLLEIMYMYRDHLRIEGRAKAEAFWYEIGAEDLSCHIRPCFDDNGVVLDVDHNPNSFKFVN